MVLRHDTVLAKIDAALHKCGTFAASVELCGKAPNEVPMVDFHLMNCSRMVRDMQKKQPASTNLVCMMTSDEDSTFDGLGDIPSGGEAGFDAHQV